MTEETSMTTINNYLPERIRRLMRNLSPMELSGLTEIRLHAGRPAALIFPGKTMFLTSFGMTAAWQNCDVVRVTARELYDSVESLAHYSLHSCTQQLREGYFTLKGGIRAGLSGCYNDSGSLTDVTGVNFRIARCVFDCGGEIFRLINSENAGVLICGAVNSGKTTLLRDLCRLTGNRRKTVLVDERNEIASVHSGSVENDIGVLTDVICGCTREKGIISAIRALSPDYIFCDEISTDADAKAILKGVGSGVKFCATTHGEELEGILRREFMRDLLGSGAFGYAVMLSGAADPGHIREIRRLENGT
ncbi:MAG: Flp pilus assembly complex ATPase component TadA [Alistipes sp.]|nr:Flp pilus assembly complex ATPase component TadA [Alistipes sp.]